MASERQASMSLLPIRRDESLCLSVDEGGISRLECTEQVFGIYLGTGNSRSMSV
jgi:hypothetical protein